MQDWKNNSQNKTPGSGPQPDGQHPFDRELKHRLTDAEVKPAGDLMDKMFAQLDATAIKENAASVSKDKAPASKTPVRPLGWFSGRMSYVAAIVGILVVLAVGIKEFSNKDSVVLPPAGLTALTTNTETDKQTPVPSVAQEAGGTGGATVKSEPDKQPESEARQPKRMHRKAEAVSHLARATDGEKQVQAATAGAVNMPSGEQPVKQLPKQVAKVASVRSVEQVGQPVNADSRANQSIVKADTRPAEPALVVTVGTGKKSLISNGHGNTPEVAAALKATSAETVAGAPVARTEDRDNRSAHRERNGLLKGIFKKIGNGARAVTEELISQEEDRTVINVGVVAITAYK